MTAVKIDKENQQEPYAKKATDRPRPRNRRNINNQNTLKTIFLSDATSSVFD